MLSALSGIPTPIVKRLQEIGDAARQSVYVVGGFVRDLLLQRENLDLDIVVEGDALGLAHRLAEKWGGKLQSHHQFGTATVTRPDGVKIDFVTARSETYEQPGALPLVRQGTIVEDLQRRDFSINALAIYLNPDDFGRMVDCTGGLEDLHHGRVRVLHEQSFKDDPTRIFRAIRYEQRYGFRIVERDETLIREAIGRGVLGRVSGQRIRSEIDRILIEEASPRMVKRMLEFDLFRAIQPHWSVAPDFDPRWDITQQAIDWALEHLPADETDTEAVRWMPLLDTVDVIEAVGDRLVLENQLRKKLIATVEVLKNLDALLSDALPSEIYRLLKPYPMEALVFALVQPHQPDWRGEQIDRYLINLRHVQPLINGDDLIQLGLKPSEAFVGLLWRAFSAQLDEKIVTKQEAYQFLGYKKT
jgi:tRNA nucleotidyltransferase (CCA-adding enzyme)